MVIVLYGQADSPDIYYRCKWNSDVNCLLIDNGDNPILYVPGFEYLRAKAQATVNVQKLTDIKEHLKNIDEEVQTNTSFPYAIAKHLDVSIHTKREVYDQRITKSAEEIKEIERAQIITQEAIDIVIDMLKQAKLKDGVAHLNGEVLTAEMCKLAARTHLIQHNADCEQLIVASAKQTAQPHNRGSGPIKEGPVIIDIFAKTQTGYHGDCTRTYILGTSDNAQELLTAVQKAHDTCIEKCIPGQSISELYELAKNIMQEEGFETTDEQGFIHSLGHGVGLDIHESPNLSPNNTDVLKQGMTITIEPGLYYDIGVRHENIVVVQEQPQILGKRQ